MYGYASPSTTSVVEKVSIDRHHQHQHHLPYGTQTHTHSIEQVSLLSRKSSVIALVLCLVLCAVNGTASFSIDYETYYQYTPSFEMVPSLYQVDLSSWASLTSVSLSDAIKSLQDAYGFGYITDPGTTNTNTNTNTRINTKTPPSSCIGAQSHCQNNNDNLHVDNDNGDHDDAHAEHIADDDDDDDEKFDESNGIQYYNVAWSTEQNYQNSEMIFEGRYKSIRSSLDYTYHHNYSPKRQLLQDVIVTKILQKHNVEITDSDGNSCISPKNPWIVFTAGAMGSGKSYTIRHLAAKDRFPLDSFVTVDPDEIRRLLPEFELYLDHCPEMAGENTRKEAGFIAEMLTQLALEAGRNVLVDGSLNDAEWYQDYFNILRKDYGDRRNGLKIGILHITAPREAVFERAQVSTIQYSTVHALHP